MSLPSPSTPAAQQDPESQPAKGGRFLTGADTNAVGNTAATDPSDSVKSVPATLAFSSVMEFPSEPTSLGLDGVDRIPELSDGLEG
jgi:hypothetical protein